MDWRTIRQTRKRFTKHTKRRPMRPSRFDFDFATESLEKRELLAGVVNVVQFANGNVHVVGDQFANELAVEVAVDGSLTFRAAEETVLRWKQEHLQELTLTSTANLTIRLRGGDDTLTIRGAGTGVPGRLLGTTVVSLAGGHDDVRMSQLELSGNLVLDTSSGDDIVRLSNVTSSASGRLTTGPQSDRIYLDDTRFAGVTSVHTLGGDDMLELMHQVNSSRMTVGLGGGLDQLRLGDTRNAVDISSNAAFHLGGGNDELLSFLNPQALSAKYIAGTGRDRLLARDSFQGLHSGFEVLNSQSSARARGPVTLDLDPIDAALNTRLIEAHVLQGGHVIIPRGTWPVQPISMGTNSVISGWGVGVSELRLEISGPSRYDPQHIISTMVQADPAEFTRGVVVQDITLNGNYSNIDWDQIYNDGNAFGLYVRGAKDSLFTNIEIKNCWTDGIYISTVLGQANNTNQCLFDSIVIRDCGRQGVSIVGGEELLLNDFQVVGIGRRDGLGTSPRAALDIEPEENVQRITRHITISNWEIHHVGQGILVSAGHSAEQAEDIVIHNIYVEDMNGPQVLAVRDVERLLVTNFYAVDHHATTGGLGVLFRDSTGVVDGLTVVNSSQSNFPLRIDGASNLDLRNVVVDGATRGALQIGAEPGGAQQATHVRLSNFEFRDIGGNSLGLPVGRINSSGSVVLTGGTISGLGPVTHTMQLFSDTTFYDCSFASGTGGIFDSSKMGQSLGSGNNWN